MSFSVSAAGLFPSGKKESRYCSCCWLLTWTPIGIFPARERARGHGERAARAYNGSLGAEFPARSRGTAPGQGSRGLVPWSWKLWSICTRKGRPKTLLSVRQDRLNMALATSKQTQPSPVGLHWSTFFAWPHVFFLWCSLQGECPPLPMVVYNSVVDRRRTTESSKINNMKICGFMTLTFLPKNKWVSKTHRQTYLCQVGWSKLHRFLWCRVEKQTNCPSPRMPSAWVTTLVLIHTPTRVAGYGFYLCLSVFLFSRIIS